MDKLIIQKSVVKAYGNHTVSYLIISGSYQGKINKVRIVQILAKLVSKNSIAKYPRLLRF